MARYKETEKGQGLIVPIYLDEQLIPGTFEYTLNELIDTKMDLSIFDQKYKNDITGAKAIEPGILLKIILYWSRNYDKYSGYWYTVGVRKNSYRLSTLLGHLGHKFT